MDWALTPYPLRCNWVPWPLVRAAVSCSKQLLKQTYDVAYPGVIAIYLTGKPQPFVGPHDIALAICGAVYKNGYVKNKVMEFVGPGVSSMTTDYRNAWML